MSRLAKVHVENDLAKVVAPRISVGWKVGIKTFGTKNYLSFTAKDVSTSGILLKLDDLREQAPFQAKTLLEMVFYPDGHLFHEEIIATAVVVRAVVGAGGHTKEEFGVRIIEAPEAFSSALTQALSAA
jgi:PilZ domain